MSTRERRILVAVIAAGALLRVLHTATSLGTPDAVLWTQHVMRTERVGVLRAYFEDSLVNHPPLALAVARLSSEAGQLVGLQFQDVFRLLQTLADAITTLALARLAGLFAASMFMLSPAAVFISGFHCQSDPLMTMFLVLAVMARQPVVAGLMIGCAAGIKIVALVALPLVMLRFRGRELVLYLSAAAATLAVMFGPAIAVTGTVVLRNVFAYAGWRVSWGLSYVLRAVPHIRVIAIVALLLSLAVLWFVELRRRTDDPLRTARVVGIALLLVLVLAPGFGVQYLFWLLPFLALMLHRYEALAMHGILSAFLFAMYTAWSDGWPWWFGTHSAGISGVYWAVGVWVALAIALGISVKRAYA